MRARAGFRPVGRCQGEEEKEIQKRNKVIVRITS